MATSIVPAIYDPALADRALEVETEAAYAMAKQVGPGRGSAGGHLGRGGRGGQLTDCPREVAAGRSAVIVTVLPDSADKYLSERFWEEA
jgi:S-sulfo-L-cysteine synthase (O-acetyl-L-serine-dependent)